MTNKKKPFGCDEKGFPTDPRHPWNRESKSSEEQKKAFLFRELISAQKAYEGGNIGVLFDVWAFCEDFSLSPPFWVREGFENSHLEKMSGGSKGKKGQRNLMNRYLSDMRDYERYETVLESREHGTRWLEAYDEASEVLEATFSKGSPGTMQAAYRRVKKRLKENPYRYWVVSKIPLK